MNQDWTLANIKATLKKDLLLDKFDLASGGLKVEDIHDDTPLLNEGLALDSVDALDLLVAVEKTFSLKLPDPDRSFIERTCKDVGTLAHYVLAQLDRSQVAAGS